MLWVDKYRPGSLESCDFHVDLSKRLLALAQGGDIPHMLFYGPSGAGKKTRIMGLLKAIYGPSAEKLRLEKRKFQKPTDNKSIEITAISSNHHIELNPSEAGVNDRFVVQEVIKDIAQFRPLEGQRTYKVVVLTQVDSLSKDAQQALRRTMEKYAKTCRLIMVCESSSRVMEPLRSRCLSIRVPAPSQVELMNALEAVCKRESLVLPKQLAAKIAARSNRNARRAVLMLEACKVSKYPFTADQPVEVMDWEVFVAAVAEQICNEQTPQCLLRIRGALYELLQNCIPADVIIKTLTNELMTRVPDDVKHHITHWAAFYEKRLHVGNKEIFHLEAFCARVMSVYKQIFLNASASA